ncbi:glycosyltransferase family protein [Dyadobacter sp. CY312]|uniref:glycosyltransferase family protein n=1 Tax=Dyadobacter sp. CY312 TaxID=2907303 RepID=UPI001F422555|nr:glycosyltransferase family protein [Dyadobacter sp. CY312]MCE7042133.1 glycosyl transferase [Dyadobacter sp. CY312]
MKILFLVQGEGRGHMTQAISLSQILRRAGHEIAATLVGKASDRIIPSFFAEQIKAPVYEFIAPAIVYSQCGAGMNVGRTLYALVRNSPRYFAGLKSIHEKISEVQPDLIISFYETYSGLYNVIFRPKIPMLCIAHQYLLLHPKFVFPKNKTLDRILINLNSKAASWLATKRLALSFREMEGVLKEKISVVPPLLRREVLDLAPSKGDFFLVYMTHHSLSKQIIAWHLAHPNVALHCFWDNSNVSDEFVFDKTLTFHRINSEKYLEKLASCKALVTTAGFESVCEAMYLGKPVMMVPVPNHFEQECNAIDGVIAGAGVTSKTFDLSVLMEYLPKHQDQTVKFRKWYRRGESMFLNKVAAAGKKPVVRRKSRTISVSAQRIFNTFF